MRTYLSGVVIGMSPVLSTKIANSLAGSVLLSFSLIASGMLPCTMVMLDRPREVRS